MRRRPHKARIILLMIIAVIVLAFIVSACAPWVDPLGQVAIEAAKEVVDGDQPEDK